MSSSHRAIPGNVAATLNEGRRLAELADLHEHGRQVLHALRTDSWCGPAADQFDEIRRAQALDWARASDSHADAGVAITRYAEQLGELQRLSDSLVLGAQESGNPALIVAAEQSVQRFRDQVVEAAALAASAVRAATESLRGLGLDWAPWSPGAVEYPVVPSIDVPLVPSDVAKPTADQAAVDEPQTAPKPTGRHRMPASPIDYRDPHYLQSLRRICYAVLDALTA